MARRRERLKFTDVQQALSWAGKHRHRVVEHVSVKGQHRVNVLSPSGKARTLRVEPTPTVIEP